MAANIFRRVLRLKIVDARAIVFYLCSGTEMVMSEITELVVPFLQKLQANMADVKEDLHHIKVRVSSMEENVGGMNRRFDRLDTKVERIEKRLGLIEV
jgi:predicted nuclease with TOPRIM domain